MADLERDFRRQVLPFLKTLSATEIFPISQRSMSGDPDYLLCIRGHFVGLELKRLSGHPSEIQLYKKRKIEQAGGTYLLASPSNWKEIQTELKGLAS